MGKNSNHQILAGIRVLDLSRVMSGPFCTSMLADLGAEVIKIEIPESGDESRFFGPHVDGESAYFVLLNRNKKSVTVDLKSDQGRQVLHALIPQCDVLVENFRPGVTNRLGLDYTTIKALNPSLVYTSISGFGQESPYQNQPAFDLVVQAMSGIMSLTGPQGGPPTAVGESIADVCTGIYAAFGTMAALFARSQTGQGQQVDVAMLDCLYSMQLTGLARLLYTDETPVPVGNRHPVTYPVDSFNALDGDIVLVCFSDHTFAVLCRLMEEEALSTDPRFATNKARSDNERVLHQLINSWTSTQRQESLLTLLLEAGIPAAPVWDLKQVSESEQVQARQLIVDANHAKLGSVPLVPQPVRFTGASQPETWSSPVLGQHTKDVLETYTSFSPEEISEMQRSGAD